MAIKRIWHGWTDRENADAYERLLYDGVFPLIAAKKIRGYRGIELLRRELDEEVEFVTIMTFESLRNVIDFQREDYARAFVPTTAQKLLKRWNQLADHYEVREVRVYG